MLPAGNPENFVFFDFFWTVSAFALIFIENIVFFWTVSAFLWINARTVPK